MRKQAREAGDVTQINLWAGEAHELARERPAAEIVRELTAGALTALDDARKLATGRRMPSGRGPQRETHEARAAARTR